MKNDYESFFKRLFAPGSEPMLMAQALVSGAQATIKFGLFQFHVAFPSGKTYAAKLSVASPAILNDSTPKTELQSVAVTVREVVEKAYYHFQMVVTGPSGAPEGTLKYFELSLDDDKKPSTPKAPPAWMSSVPIPKAQIIKPEDQNAPASPAKAKTGPFDNAFTPAKPSKAGVVQLSKATALGQKVAGTSMGSTYTVVALGPVNVAIRVSSDKDSVSVRMAPPNGIWPAKTKDSLTEAGLSDNGSYMSIHMSSLGPLPVMRVVGALLFSAEVPYNAIATTMEQLNAPA